MERPVLLISTPRSGSDWFAYDLLRWANPEYFREYFNPTTNFPRSSVIRLSFGSETDWQNLALPWECQEDLCDYVLKASWGIDQYRFDKENYAAFKIGFFVKHFECFALIGHRILTFPGGSQPKSTDYWWLRYFQSMEFNRELLQFQFFIHLFLLLRQPGYTPKMRRGFAIFGAAIYLLPLFTYRLPPTFNSMSWDRRLVLSGQDQIYWQHVRELLQPGDKVGVLIPRAIFDSDRFDEPYSLLGTYNYACIDGIINTSGYSSTTPLKQLYTRVGYYPFGAYIPEQRADLLRDHPDMKLITLESLQPVKITLSSATGPAIDLTPYIPHELDPKPHPVRKPGDDPQQ